MQYLCSLIRDIALLLICFEEGLQDRTDGGGDLSEKKMKYGS